MIVEEKKIKEVKFSETYMGDLIKFNDMYFLVVDRLMNEDNEWINVINITNGYPYFVRDNDIVTKLTARAKVIIED